MSPKSAGLLGGTFNPIHNGHLTLALQCLEKLSLREIIFIVAGSPPLKHGSLAPAQLRLQMARLATENIERFSVSEIECTRPGPSYTVDTLRIFKKQNPGLRTVFITGVDAFLDLPKWKEPEKLLEMTNFVITGRPGEKFSALSSSPYLNAGRQELSALDSSAEPKPIEVRLCGSGRTILLLPVNTPSVSSTIIRQRLKKGQQVFGMLPQNVENFIMKHDLYE